MITFEKVTKRFSDGTLGLGEASFQIKTNEFVFFIGPSGAGKTTVMKLLRREISPSEGVITVKDKNINQLEPQAIPALRRNVAMCYQDFRLLADRTVLENVALPLEIAGVSEPEKAERIADVLKKVNLGKKANFFPVQLSGGELQRVGIARAIVGKPDVILADEPTGNLDPEAAFEIIKLFKEINLAQTTIIVATHNADLVNQFKERVIELKHGKIIRDQKKAKYVA
ncbi:ATP-binding cassette domain-containing protein [Patescibacteria group bacterium]|nr:ATP-binding cassette domain-containing protein [Patescibacteria group bacterium]